MRLFFYVSPVGLEPTTHSLKGCRSNRLSYGPIFTCKPSSIFYQLLANY